MNALTSEEMQARVCTCGHSMYWHGLGGEGSCDQCEDCSHFRHDHTDTINALRGERDRLLGVADALQRLVRLKNIKDRNPIAYGFEDKDGAWRDARLALRKAGLYSEPYGAGRGARTLHSQAEIETFLADLFIDDEGISFTVTLLRTHDLLVELRATPWRRLRMQVDRSADSYRETAAQALEGLLPIVTRVRVRWAHDKQEVRK